MRARVFAIPLLWMLSPALVIATQPVPFAGHRIVTAITQNIYDSVNAEFSALLSATSQDLPEKVAAVAATRPGGGAVRVDSGPGQLLCTAHPADGDLRPQPTSGYRPNPTPALGRAGQSRGAELC